MYTIIYWQNKDVTDHGLLSHLPSVLTIGRQDRHLNWRDLMLSVDQISQLDKQVILIFDSHGNDNGNTCTYTLEDENGAEHEYNSIDVINEILKPINLDQGVTLHVLSCHASKVQEELAQQAMLNSVAAKWLNNTIFIHGGDDIIRGYRTKSSFKIILDNLENNSQEHFLAGRLDLFKDIYIKSPGDLTFIQMPNAAGNTPLLIKNNFVGANLRNTEEYLARTLAETRTKINTFLDDNNFSYKLEDDLPIDLFSYLKNGLAGGADKLYGLTFPLNIGTLDGNVVNVDDKEVVQFVDDLYSLVETNKLSKSQFDELIAIQFFYNAASVHLATGAKITFPPGMGLKLTSSYEKLFQKGFDVTKVEYNGAPFLNHLLTVNSYPDHIKTILNMDSIKCGSLNVKFLGTRLFFLVFGSEYAKEILPIILKKLEDKIDLSIEISQNYTYLDYLKYNDDCKPYLGLILEKSLPIAQELISDLLLSNLAAGEDIVMPDSMLIGASFEENT